jgi:hypothetical protein
MSDEDKTMGEVMDEVQLLGWSSYVDCTGKVWRLKYLGEVATPEWVIPEAVDGQ